MREILFRGKRLDNGEWIEGYVMMHDHDKATIFRQNQGDGSLEGFEVDPETVCQSTGITDRNGVKIWEGDAVSTDLERPYLIVEFRDGCFMFNCNDGGEDYYDMLPILKEPQTFYKYGKVIGNIFDNPELMEEGTT